ncbi:DUF1534 domain-containing protein [Pseudomonas edaphica]|uniref:DUF1534 domain-containing protein n=1 Tax=Pseudomonas edaphica TaxID=2006980 RepID=A0ABY2U8L4_9PSED|nr:DUF1534 domain-containing protein [Pseudomonas sp. PA-5-4H]MCF5235913.1 DUF1534 domain-containing protein [Pseudomonas sp. PA-5-4G]MCF5251314.1 DUF1534 domain-containing protein [Pseudomonas sp. PA-5-4B]MCF5263428.1 DUF1534 domain-containing protein [Pseudomonas sp. PA-5-4A]TLG92574.1 DUF1534 domain-containing protein [Pseudomonas edaphica]
MIPTLPRGNVSRDAPRHHCARLKPCADPGRGASNEAFPRGA